MLLLCRAGMAQAENWMSRLPDDAYVATLSIPGAHDAATGSGWGEGFEEFGELYARTQDLTIAEQWSAGVRAFDLRPCVYDGFMNLNHGMVATQIHFEDVLRQLRDSLQANPSEFIIIHMLHETDGDQIENVYDQRIVELLGQDDLKDCFVKFKRTLTVGEMRGKILLLSRDKYSDDPVGGYFTEWTGSVDWSKQQAAHIRAKGVSAQLTVQDYSDTHNTGGLKTKVDAIKKVMDYSTKQKFSSPTGWRWIFNFASAYSLVMNLFGFEVSLSDGYRDNAAHTHAAILAYLNNESYQPGPLGVVLMDYVGVDKSGTYDVRGKELADAIINNNFGYLNNSPSGISLLTTESAAVRSYALSGMAVSNRLSHGVQVIRQPDGNVRKVIKKQVLDH